MHHHDGSLAMSELKDKYPNFAGYLGIDSRSGGGNSVIHKISVSMINSWEEIYNSGVVTINDPVYVNLSMKGKKYIKLEADSRREGIQNHVVYADAGFVTNDYTPSENYNAQLKRWQNMMKS